MNTTKCTATNVNGKQCKRVGYNWSQIGGQVLCAPHAFAALAAQKAQ